MINYKASAGDVLHSIEIHTSDYDKFLEVAAKIKEFMQGRIVSQDMGD